MPENGEYKYAKLLLYPILLYPSFGSMFCHTKKCLSASSKFVMSDRNDQSTYKMQFLTNLVQYEVNILLLNQKLPVINHVYGLSLVKVWP